MYKDLQKGMSWLQPLPLPGAESKAARLCKCTWIVSVASLRLCRDSKKAKRGLPDGLGSVPPFLPSCAGVGESQVR
jgi:hypothetical protein